MLAGAIYADASKVGMDGDSMFENNSAGSAAGEKGRASCIACHAVEETSRSSPRSAM